MADQRLQQLGQLAAEQQQRLASSSSSLRSPSQPAMSLSNILNTNGDAPTGANGVRSSEPHPSPSARSVTSISSLLDDGAPRNGHRSPSGGPSQLPQTNSLRKSVSPSRAPGLDDFMRRAETSMQPPAAPAATPPQRHPSASHASAASAPTPRSSSKSKKAAAKDTDGTFRAKHRPISSNAPSYLTAPTTGKRRRESASNSGWASDLSNEDNRRIWQPEIEDYAEGLQIRRDCLESAFFQQEVQKNAEVSVRVSHAYQRRYTAVLRKAEERKQAEEQKIRDAEAAKADKARARQEAQEKRQTSAAASASGSVSAAASTSKAKSADSRKRIKVNGSSPPPFTPKTEYSSRQGSEELEEPPVIVGSSKTAKVAEPMETQFERVWQQIARKDIPQAQRLMTASAANKQMYWRRHSVVAQRESKRGVLRTIKTSKDVTLRSRKVMREMLVFWKRNEKEERELRKRAEKEALDKAKKEEDLREAKRQARKLNFLISQTELFSHFVGSKLKTNEAEDSAETSGGASKITEISDRSAASAATVPDVPANGELQELDFDEEDDTNLRAHAARKAQEAVLAAKQKAQDFDSAAAEERKNLQAAAAAGEEGALGKVFDSDDLNFNNPTSMGEMDLRQPKMLTVTLKDYQLKGLNWLANLYEQGINGILADEMGLGKTIQSISLMAYLAEVHDIWGPFLVIAPASTLHNWQQEISRFVPHLKPLPYWGSVKDRAVLRKFWNRKQMSYTRDAPFHILVTSYQLVVTDEKYFQRVKWQYMILDEAQAIKSSQSNRWKTLLGFQCRNRLLLTGTPVQNSMQELWALLHFIMPSLFDSHDEFSEWFSKDIESHAENKGTLNEHQLRRLHMILKPFMLRRIKKNVQNELGDKIEIDLFCDLSARQRMLYRALRSHVSVAEIMDKVGNINDEAGLKHLMNLVMQFRKVCNHPELFERADVRSPFAFANFSQSGSLSREGDVIDCPDSMRNRIEFRVPKLMVRDGGIFSIPGVSSRKGFETHYLDNLMNIWRADHVHRSVKQGGDSAFGFLSLLNMSAADAELSFHGNAALRALYHAGREEKLRSHRNLIFDDEYAVSALRPQGIIRKPMPSNSYEAPSIRLSLDEVAEDYRTHSYFSRPNARTCFPAAVAPPIGLYANDGPFFDSQERLKGDALVSQALFGLTPQAREEEDAVERLERALPGVPPIGLLAASSRDQLPASGMAVPQMNKLVVDSSKLARLDTLLRELKAGGHRVLIYFQMTRMIDLMEEYLIYRQYKYLRLDGSSKISDRRDMVTDWQTKPELFIFLLSTRAGGLGINLTAADTVIFYDHDWNPSNDSQAMDRAHRLGQTKQVTVYRLITKSTIDERIVKLARNKKEVQDIVVGNKAYTETGMARPQEIVSLLLDDDELAASMLRRKQAEEAQLAQGKADQARASHIKRRQNRDKANAAANAPAVSLSWQLEDDEDDFFGAKPPLKDDDAEPAAAAPKKKKAPRKKAPTAGAAAPPEPELDENGEPVPPRPTKKGRKKTMDELAGTAM